MPDASPTALARNWLAELERALAAGDIEGTVDLFEPEGFWRDLLTFTWNIKTMEGRAAIRAMLEATLAPTRPTRWRLIGEPTVEDDVVLAWFSFETALAHGHGICRLRAGRCRTLLTAMQDLKGFEEPLGPRRPQGLVHKADRERRTWSEERRAEIERLGFAEQPHVVVIGGGQGGIALGARLKQLGVPAIILEKNARAGDSWRHRYRTLVLHDPVWFDHLPYIPFPDNWPVFTPKDKMGDWLEMYAKVMELDYWTESPCQRAIFDETTRTWRVEVERQGRTVTLEPKHIVFATGAYGPPRTVDLPGQEEFGGRILHSSAYTQGTDFAGLRCAVLGTASSGHDVAVDLWERGAAEITMLQRSPTTVVKSETLMATAFANYSEAALARGITTEKADMLLASMPAALHPEVQIPLWRQIRERDADYYAAIERAGFAIDFGEDESGLMMKAWRTGSGYYIDVGASQLVIDGEIGVKSGVGVERLTERRVHLTDGSVVEADVLIQCTGYHSMHETVAEIVSREAADAIGPCWGLGSGVRGDPGPWKGELRNMWKPTAVEALWFHGGNLALSRFYSKMVALQLKARLEGLPTPVYGEPG